MSEPEIRITCLTGTITLTPPRYWVEPRRDMRGRPIDYTLKCDAGCDLLGFESESAAIEMAASAGYRVSTPLKPACP